MTPITTEHVAALKNAREHSQGCADALRKCLHPGTAPVLSYAVRDLLISALDLRHAIDALCASAVEEEAGVQ